MSRDRRKQFNNSITEHTIRKFKEIVIRKYGIYAKNLWSYEVERALRYYISVGGIFPDSSTRSTHTQDIEQKDIPIPISHAATAKGKLIKLSTNSANGMTALVTSGDRNGNGNGKSEDNREYWELNDDPLIVDWAKQLGMEDVLDDPKNIYNYASKETIENTSRCMVDPEFKKQYHERLLKGLLARKGQKVYERRFEEGNKKLRDELVVIKKHLWENQHYDQQNIVRQSTCMMLSYSLQVRMT